MCDSVGSGRSRSRDKRTSTTSSSTEVLCANGARSPRSHTATSSDTLRSRPTRSSRGRTRVDHRHRGPRLVADHARGGGGGCAPKRRACRCPDGTSLPADHGPQATRGLRGPSRHLLIQRSGARRISSRRVTGKAGDSDEQRLHRQNCRLALWAADHPITRSGGGFHYF